MIKINEAQKLKKQVIKYFLIIFTSPGFTFVIIASATLIISSYLSNILSNNKSLFSTTDSISPHPPSLSNTPIELINQIKNGDLQSSESTQGAELKSLRDRLNDLQIRFIDKNGDLQSSESTQGAELKTELKSLSDRISDLEDKNRALSEAIIDNPEKAFEKHSIREKTNELEKDINEIKGLLKQIDGRIDMIYAAAVIAIIASLISGLIGFLYKSLFIKDPK